MIEEICQNMWLSQVDSEVCELLDDLKKKFRDRAKYWAEKTPEGDRTDPKFVANAILNTVLDEYQHALFI